MPCVTRGVSWLFKQISRDTGPVFGLGRCDTSVWVSSSDCALYGVHVGEIVI